MAKHTFHVDGDTLYPVLVRILEQEEPVSAVITMQNGSVFTLLVEASNSASDDAENCFFTQGAFGLFVYFWFLTYFYFDLFYYYSYFLDFSYYLVD